MKHYTIKNVLLGVYVERQYHQNCTIEHSIYIVT